MTTVFPAQDPKGDRLMIMPKTYHIMHRDTPVADVITENNMVISIIKYVKDSPMQPFCGITKASSRQAMTKRFYGFLESRCYENNRADLPYILKQAGLTSNNPYEWIHVCHGVTWEDFFWVRFDDEDIHWDDVRIR